MKRCRSFHDEWTCLKGTALYTTYTHAYVFEEHEHERRQNSFSGAVEYSILPSRYVWTFSDPVYTNLAPHLLGLPIENPLKIQNKINPGSKKTTIPRLSRVKDHRKLENVCTAPVEHHLKIVKSSSGAEFEGEYIL